MASRDCFDDIVGLPETLSGYLNESPETRGSASLCAGKALWRKSMNNAWTCKYSMGAPTGCLGVESHNMFYGYRISLNNI